jgi:hypothetical protein
MKQILTLEQLPTLSARLRSSQSVQSFVMPSPFMQLLTADVVVADVVVAVVDGHVAAPAHVAANVAAANRLENGRIAFGWAAWDTTGAPKSQAMTTSPSATTECCKTEGKTAKTMKPCTRKSNNSYAKKYTKRPLSWSGDPNG